MSAVVDERIVRLDFDNENFERKVGVSSRTVEKLKQTLNFDSSNKNLLSLNESAKKINFAPISSGIESVKMEFSALQVAAMTTVSNITNSIINTGKNLVYKFNIEPITSGLQEYETQINSVQTILANTQDKGTTLDQVNAALDELNHYADMTIYNFTQMTRNIGTFTAAGVDLQTSVNAIQGIANLAAVSGSTSQQASVAMYQLSQALATGTVKLQDWNSVVNAGMGGQVFQNALKRTATVMGTNVDALIEKYGSFRESLTQGNWLTTEVLTETLGQFAGAYDEATLLSKGYSQEQTQQILQMSKTATDAATKVKTFTQLMDTLGEAAQSGWTETWELIIGDFDQAKNMWTGVSDVLQEVIGNSANARNALVSNVMQSNWDKFAQELEKTGISMDELTDKIRITAAEAGYEDLDGLIEKYGTLGEVFEHGALSSDILERALLKVNTTVSDLKDVTAGLEFGSTGDDVSKVQKALVDLGYTLDQYGIDGKIGSETVEAIKAFQEANGLDITGIVDEKTLAALQSASGHISNISNQLLLLARDVDQLGGRSLILESFSNIWKAASQVAASVKAGWKDVFPESTASRAEKILGIIKSFNEFTKGMNLSTKDSERLRESFSGLFSIVKLVSDVFNGGLKTGSTFLKAMFGDVDIDVISLIEHMGSMTQRFTDWVRQTNVAKDAATKLAPAIQNGVDKFKDWAGELNVVQEAQDFFKNMENSLDEISKMDDASIGDKIGVIKDHLMELGGNRLAAIANGFLNFGSVMKSTFQEMPEFVDGGIEKFKEFVEYVRSLGGITKDNIGDVLGKFNDTIGKYVRSAGDTFTEFSDAVGTVKDKATGYVDSLLGVGDKIKGFFSDIAAFADDHEIGRKLTNGAVAVGLFTLSFKLLGIVKNLTNVAETVAGFIGDFAKATLKEKEAKAITESYKKYLMVAGALLMVAIAIKTLSTIPWAQMKVALIGMVGTIAIMTVAVAAMELIGKKIGVGASVKFSLSIMSLVGSLILIVAALKAMETLSPDNPIAGNLAILTIILGGLLAVSVVMGKFGTSGSGSIKQAGTILALAVSVVIIVKALKELNTMTGDINNLIISCTLLAGLMIALGVVSVAMGKMSFSGGMGILATVVSIKILINILKEIVELDLSGLKGKMGELTTIFLLIVGLMAATRLAGKHAAGGGVGILAISAGIYLLIGAIKLLGSMNSGTLNKGVQAVSQIMIIMGLVTALSGLSGKNAVRAGAQILLMTVAISAIALVITLLGGMDPAGLYRALNVITKVTAIFGALMVITDLMASGRNIKMGPIIAMTALIGVITGSIALLAGIDGNIEGAAEALVSVAAVFSALARAIGFMNLLSPDLKTTITTVVAITAVLAAMSIVIALIAKFANVEQYVKIAYGLATFMNALASFTTAAAVLSLGAGGMASLLKTITALTAIGLALYGLNKIFPQIGEFLSSGMPFLEQMFTGIGTLIGDVINGVVDKVTPDVEGIGNGLSKMVENLKPFCDGVKGIDDSTVTGVKNLVAAMMAITAESLFDRIASIGSDETSIERFAGNLEVFAQALIGFNDTVTGAEFNTEKIEQATNAGRIIGEMTQSIPTTGGFLNFLMGEHDLGGFSSNLGAFGRGVAAFSRSVNGVTIDEDKVTSAVEAGAAIANMSSTIPTTGGFLNWIMGEHDLGTFSSNLGAFGRGVAAFVNSLKGADFATDNISGAMSVISRLANVNETLTHSNELSLQAFTDSLDTIQENLSTFITNIQNLEIGAAETKIAQILELFRTLKDGLTKNGTDAETISALMSNLTTSIKDSLTELSGDQSISTSAQGVLTTFAAGITANENLITDALYNAITGAVGKASINATNDTSIQTSANRLAQNLATAMRDTNTAGISSAAGGQATAALSSITSKTDQFSTAGKLLVDSLTSGLGANTAVIRTTLTTAISQALAGVRSYENAGYNSGYLVGKEIGTGMVNGLEAKKSAIKTALTTAISQALAGVKSYENAAYNAGYSIGDNTGDGIKARTSAIKTALTSAISRAIAGARSYTNSAYNAGYSVGKNFGSGMSAGIGAWIRPVSEKAARMVREAKTAADKEADSHSPSKEMKKRGKWFAQGFALGIENDADLASKASKRMVSGSIGVMQNTLSTLGSIIPKDLDNIQPTIAPVVDMTNVQRSANIIDNMLSFDESLNIMSDLKTINRTMGRSSQNGDPNASVVSELQKLTKLLQTDRGGNTYIDGISYSSGSDVANAVNELIRAVNIRGRV